MTIRYELDERELAALRRMLHQRLDRLALANADIHSTSIVTEYFALPIGATGEWLVLSCLKDFCDDYALDAFEVIVETAAEVVRDPLTASDIRDIETHALHLSDSPPDATVPSTVSWNHFINHLELEHLSADIEHIAVFSGTEQDGDAASVYDTALLFTLSNGEQLMIETDNYGVNTLRLRQGRDLHVELLAWYALRVEMGDVVLPRGEQC